MLLKRYWHESVQIMLPISWDLTICSVGLTSLAVVSHVVGGAPAGVERGPGGGDATTSIQARSGFADI